MIYLWQVTGAARGLGREICLRLVKEGTKLTCVDISTKGVLETAEMCNALRAGCATGKLCDITDRKQISKLVSEVPPVDILINNAGIVDSSSILEGTDAGIERMVQVNVMAQFWVSVIPLYYLHL